VFDEQDVIQSILGKIYCLVWRRRGLAGGSAKTAGKKTKAQGDGRRKNLVLEKSG